MPAVGQSSECKPSRRAWGGRTAFIDDVEACVRDVVVLEFILALNERPYEDGMVLGRNEGDCIEPQLGRHDGESEALTVMLAPTSHLFPVHISGTPRYPLAANVTTYLRTLTSDYDSAMMLQSLFSLEWYPYFIAGHSRFEFG